MFIIYIFSTRCPCLVPLHKRQMSSALGMCLPCLLAKSALQSLVCVRPDLRDASRGWWKRRPRKAQDCRAHFSPFRHLLLPRQMGLSKIFRRKRVRYNNAVCQCETCTWIFNTNLFSFTIRKPNIFNVVFMAIGIDINVIRPLWERNLEFIAINKIRCLESE